MYVDITVSEETALLGGWTVGVAAAQGSVTSADGCSNQRWVLNEHRRHTPYIRASRRALTLTRKNCRPAVMYANTGSQLWL